MRETVRHHVDRSGSAVSHIGLKSQESRGDDPWGTGPPLSSTFICLNARIQPDQCRSLYVATCSRHLAPARMTDPVSGLGVRVCIALTTREAMSTKPPAVTLCHLRAALCPIARRFPMVRVRTLTLICLLRPAPAAAQDTEPRG